MSTLTNKSKEQVVSVTDEQIANAAKRAGYRSEDFKKECNAICENANYLSLSEEQKEKIKEAKERVVELNDNEELLPDEDIVSNPIHYQSMSGSTDIDCITAMRAAFGDYETSVFCKICAFKYLFRADSKGGNTDILKAIWYLKKFLELGGCDQ